MMRFAVADTGSNTIRLGIYEYENHALTQIYTTAVFANLAGFIHDGALTPEGIRVAEDAILSHAKTAAEFGLHLHVFATAAIRNAKNTEEICTEIKKHTGAAVDVLSGEEEALFSFYGAVPDFPVSCGVMADVGGGSSEIIMFSNQQPDNTLSVPLGSLKAFKTFVSGPFPNKQEAESIQSAISNALDRKPAFRNVICKNLCIVGGGVRASKKLAAALLGEHELTVAAIHRMLEQIINNPEDVQTVIHKTIPKRAQTIAPALAIYSAVGSYFGAEKIFVSDKGIKEGYIFSRLINS